MVNWKDPQRLTELIAASIAVHGKLDYKAIAELLTKNGQPVTGNAVELQLRKYRQIGEELKAGTYKAEGLGEGTPAATPRKRAAPKSKAASNSASKAKKSKSVGAEVADEEGTPTPAPKKMKKEVVSDDEEPTSGLNHEGLLEA